jgi:hypothetical protein
LASYLSRAVLIGPEGASKEMPDTDIIFANIRIGSRGTEHLHFDAAFTVTAHRQALTPSATRLLAKLLPTSTVALWLGPYNLHCDYSSA